MPFSREKIAMKVIWIHIFQVIIQLKRGMQEFWIIKVEVTVMLSAWAFDQDLDYFIYHKIRI